MKLAKLIEFLRDRLKALIWICCGVLALVVVLVLSGVGQAVQPPSTGGLNGLFDRLAR